MSKDEKKLVKKTHITSFRMAKMNKQVLPKLRSRVKADNELA